MPERDIESLGVMGWGLDVARRFLRRRRRRRRPPYFISLQYKNSYIVLLESKTVSFWGIKSPCGRAQPEHSTFKRYFVCSQHRHLLFCLFRKTKQLYCLIRK